jgi:hypothetical protein
MKDQIFNGISVPKDCVFCKYHPSNGGSESAESQTTLAQQLKAEIVACVDRFSKAVKVPFDAQQISDFMRELRQLSAV